MQPGDMSDPVEIYGILRLHDDILREIFLWNTNIFRDFFCQTTIRLASQVCCAWRDIILNSPSIWGRLLQLDYLNQQSNIWREEVLRRSGTSLLWIHGSIRSDAQFLSFFFDNLLDQNWQRIEHLQITILGFAQETHWDVLRRPAPNLRSCFFGWYTNEFLFSHSPQPLFANFAPRLIRFSIQGVALDLNTQWLKHLRHLDLSFQPIAVDILRGLQSMIHLESLAILPVPGDSPFSIVHTSSHLPTITLPNLTKLKLQCSSFRLAVELLVHINTADGCALTFFNSYRPIGDVSVVVEELKYAGSALSTSLQRYLHPPALALHQVFVHVSAKGLGFGCTPLGGSAGDLFWEYLIDLKILGHHLWFMDIIPALISKFDLSAAKVLNLELDMGILQPPQYLTCMPLFFTFSSVTSLQVRQDDLGVILILSTYSGNPRSFVPQLNTLYVNSFKLCDPGASNAHPLLSFLRHRKDLELPVHKVVVSLTNNQEASDLKFLDEMVGLSVYWYDRNGKAFEYICGSITTYA